MLNTISVNKFDVVAELYEYQMSGLSPNSLIFLRGTPFDPPRAGMSASSLIGNFFINVRSYFS